MLRILVDLAVSAAAFILIRDKFAVTGGCAVKIKWQTESESIRSAIS